MTDRIIQFTGEECTHCKEMDPIVEQVEKELGIEFTKLEVWHNAENAAFMKQVDVDENGNEFCGGIPFFYNEKTKEKICGNTTAEKLKAFAQGGEEPSAGDGPKLNFDE